MALTQPFSSNTASAPLVAQKSQDKNNHIVLDNMLFFPKIQLLDFQVRYRVDASHFEDRQVHALQQAMIDINDILLDESSTDENMNWVCKQVRAGWFQLSEIPAANYGTCSEKTFIYLTAVYARAKEILVERWPEMFIGKKKHRNEDPETQAAEFYEDESLNAVYKLINRPRTVAELI